MAFVRSFVCIISVIATDKVRYSMVPGRTEREDGGGRRCGGNTESRWTINDKRRGRVLRESWTPTYTRLSVLTHFTRTILTNHRRVLLSSDALQQREKSTCSRRKTPHTSHNENKRVRRWSTRLIKNRSYRSVRERESRRKEEEGASRAADLIIR